MTYFVLSELQDFVFGAFELSANGGFLGIESPDQLPRSLTFRNQSTLWLALFALTVSTVLVAMSNLGSNRLVSVFGRVIYKNSTVEKIVQEEYNLKSVSSILLLLNFVITATALLYLSYANRDDLPVNEILIYYFPLLPLYFFLWPLIWFNITGVLTGAGRLLSENRKNAVLFAQIIGVVFSLLLLIWTFNLRWSRYFTITFISMMLAFWVYKLIRGLYFAIQHRISWYYILLYMCTIEILPLILLYHFVWIPLR